MTVCNPTARVHQEPNFLSHQTDELLFGETAEIIGEKDGFYEIISEYGYKGFTAKTNLFSEFKKANYQITVPFADLLLEGKMGLPPYAALPFGARINAESSHRLKTYAFVNHPWDYTLYIQQKHISPIKLKNETETQKRNRICNTAKKYLGVQYRWGGRTHLGIDCSGLCFNSYKFNGLNIWRDADMEKNKNLKTIPLNIAQKGDLLFFKNHMALYLGNNKIIHASINNGCVATENLKESPYMKNFICAATAF